MSENWQQEHISLNSQYLSLNLMLLWPWHRSHCRHCRQVRLVSEGCSALCVVVHSTCTCSGCCLVCDWSFLDANPQLASTCLRPEPCRVSQQPALAYWQSGGSRFSLGKIRMFVFFSSTSKSTPGTPTEPPEKGPWGPNGLISSTPLSAQNCFSV